MALSTPAERLEPVLTWIDAHRDAAVATLQRFCRQPSISAQNKGMQEMAELAAESLRELGAERLCAKASGAVLSQASEHDADQGDGDPGFLAGREHLIVFGEPTPSGKPSESTLDHPAALEDTKATGTDLLPIDFDPLWDQDASQAAPGMLHDLDLPPQLCLNPLAEAFLLVSAIGPDQLKTGKDALERCKQELATASVLDIGFMHQHVQDQPIRVDQEMTFAALDLLN